MDLATWASKERGRQTSLAAALGVPSQLVWQWCALRPDGTPVRMVPESRCPAIEQATDGVVPCEEQRPDLNWHRVRDPKWPWHRKGRPLLDLTVPA